MNLNVFRGELDFKGGLSINTDWIYQLDSFQWLNFKWMYPILGDGNFMASIGRDLAILAVIQHISSA